MDTTGKLIEKTEIQSGVSKAGKQWQKIGFAIKVKEQNLKFPKELYFESLNTDVIQFISDTSDGSIVRVWYDVTSRKWKDRWFTGANAFKVETVREDTSVVTGQEDLNAYADDIAAKHLRQFQNAKEVDGDDSDMPF
jgi:hypothetical protein